VVLSPTYVIIKSCVSYWTTNMLLSVLGSKTRIYPNTIPSATRCHL